MSDLVKEGREKLKSLTDENWRVDKMMHVDDSSFISWSRRNMAALLDELEAKDKEIERVQAIVLSKTKEFTKLWNRNELLEKVVEAGKYLQQVKTHKDEVGKDDWYITNRAVAWQELNKTLANLTTDQ